MNKTNTLESITPLSGQYSFRKDMKLNIWMAVAAATYLVAKFAIKDHPDWDPWLKALVAGMPLIPCLLWARTILRFIRSLDELQQRIQLEVLLFAMTGTVVVSMMITLLNTHGVLLAKFPHGLHMGGAFIVMFVLWAVRTFIVGRRYK